MTKIIRVEKCEACPHSSIRGIEEEWVICWHPFSPTYPDNVVGDILRHPEPPPWCPLEDEK